MEKGIRGNSKLEEASVFEGRSLHLNAKAGSAFSRKIAARLIPSCPCFIYNLYQVVVHPKLLQCLQQRQKLIPPLECMCLYLYLGRCDDANNTESRIPFCPVLARSASSFFPRMQQGWGTHTLSKTNPLEVHDPQRPERAWHTKGHPWMRADRPV